jgi:hypothetical protein
VEKLEKKFLLFLELPCPKTEGFLFPSKRYRDFRRFSIRNVVATVVFPGTG